MPKRFRNKSSQPKSDTTERYFRNGVEDDESSISMNNIAMTPSSSSSSQLQSSVMANDDYDMKIPAVVSTDPSPTTIAAFASTNTIVVLRDIDLPKHSPPANAVANAKMLWDVEIVLGRFAMVTALLMLVGELGFGVSPLFTLMGIF